VHEAIRADPAAKPKARSKPAEAKRWKEAKLTYEQRKDKLKVGGWVLCGWREERSGKGRGVGVKVLPHLPHWRAGPYPACACLPARPSLNPLLPAIHTYPAGQAV
jgi:hypothetical protein